MFYLGIDIGSTTAKLVLCDAYDEIIFSRYARHNAKIYETIAAMLAELFENNGDCPLRVSITGTAGMGLAERTKLPFVQEVIAAAAVVERCHQGVRTLIDIGGEDGKIILFDEAPVPGIGTGKTVLKPTIRMNGNCAGGTGAFIDQMATLLGVGVEALSDLASQSTQIYPMASRCGVFAKTDVQTLMSRNVSREDIVASVYRAVAFQTVSSLAHGADLRPGILFTGGPLCFQEGLRKAFVSVLGIQEGDTVVPKHAELFPALGAAFDASGAEMSLKALIGRMASSAGLRIGLSPSLPKLFSSSADFESWSREKALTRVGRMSLEDRAGESSWDPARGRGGPRPEFFLGIDCGSRTSKIALIDGEGRLAFEFYSGNDGDPLETVIRGLDSLGKRLSSCGLDESSIVSSASTGYGEELLKSALVLDHGIVETLAHFRAAREWDPEVSFILDIGGQDMKAIFVKDRVIQHMDLNEACSSGTGSFIESFALGLGYEIRDFAEAACQAESPRDLGTRCTVFMNSKVKQALREGATAGDISAGLAYSVIRNCFHKVLKIHNTEVLGTHVVAQGGTFKNPAVLRALELHLGFPVLRPDIAELMGAYGAALIARDRWLEARAPSTFIGFGNLDRARPLERKNIACGGCENKCTVTRLSFDGGRIHYTGNKCEKIFGNSIARGNAQGFNMMEVKRRLLFERPTRKDTAKTGESRPGSEPRIGIPRVLNLYEDYPFWCTLFTEAGFEVVLSSPSTSALAESGYANVMSENICFPAKIVHGHIRDLVEKRVDRIFFPMVRHDRAEFPGALNSYNCPVVTGYPEVIRSTMTSVQNGGVPLDSPPVSFRDPTLMREACVEYLSGLGVDTKRARGAYAAAEGSWAEYRAALSRAGAEARIKALAEGRRGILLLSRPYHADAFINHKIPEMITGLGMDVYTDDLVASEERGSLSGVEVLTQWAFPNRFYDAALWATRQDNLDVVHLNSFGCGPDAMAVDEVRAILGTAGKSPTLIRVDEVSSPGSLRLRVRSLVESIRQRGPDHAGKAVPRGSTPEFREVDKNRTILAPLFSPFYTDFILSVFRDQGYKMEILPMPDWESVQVGLAYTNHDICYPATIVIGDILKALKSGNYDQDKIAIAITQTGGQCRASSYASLLKKALIDAGFARVPVVTLTAGGAQSQKLNAQEGFHVSSLKMGLSGLFGLLYADLIAKLYYATVVRERQPGQAWALARSWLDRGVAAMSDKGAWKVMSLIPEAIQAFNSALADTNPLPKVGLVGEIFVKFNPFANNYVTEWLKDRKIEADVPPLLNFFLQKLVTDDFNHENHIERHSALYRKALDGGEGVINAYIGRVNRMLAEFRVPVTPFHTMKQLAEGASRVLSLINQYGESWLIAGDIAAFVAAGTTNVVCLQPFGCIANHIIAKGVEKRLKETYPGLGMLFLDMDAGSSEVNLANRLEFLARSAWQGFDAERAGKTLLEGQPAGSA